jgi:hypothetical protein
VPSPCLSACRRITATAPPVYADGLRLLREDFRDPVLRARGAAWGRTLVETISACFANASRPEVTARLMLAQWQGSLLWWGFEADGPVVPYVESQLQEFLAELGNSSHPSPAFVGKQDLA